VPAQVAMIPQYGIFKQIGLTNSLFGLIQINIAVTCPVGNSARSGSSR
jgi:raffinose/stachyose/melibiose transport system permease protein